MGIVRREGMSGRNKNNGFWFGLVCLWSARRFERRRTTPAATMAGQGAWNMRTGCMSNWRVTLHDASIWYGMHPEREKRENTLGRIPAP